MNMIQFGTLHPDGTVTNQRELSQDAIRACPFVIFDPSHYRPDGSCKCNDPAEQRRMVREWGYTRADIEGAGLTAYCTDPRHEIDSEPCALPCTGCEHDCLQGATEDDL